MPHKNELLFEIGTEELPPNSLLNLSQALQRNIENALTESNLDYSCSKFYATPRRIAVNVFDLCDKQPDKDVERRGPALKAAYDESGSPSKAALGFAKSCNVDIGELSHIKTEKGEWLVYKDTVKGKKTVDLLPELINKSVMALPIAKKMRWGAGDVEFVRPVHWVMLIYGGESINCEILGSQAKNFTHGHRFHAPNQFEITNGVQYLDTLEHSGYVIADFEKRKDLIQKIANNKASEIDGNAVIDEALLNEVTALNEWPVAVLGGFDRRFLNLPAEVLITTMQVNQKYFPVLGKNGELLPNFITISNLQSTNPEAIRNGNERVVKPRLADAEFFWEQDKKSSLHEKSKKLSNIVFQNKLGSIADKSKRVQDLSVYISQILSHSSDDVSQAARLAKADLLTEMVTEFPSLQGVMGKYYAQEEGIKDNIAIAIEEQYYPKKSGGQLPQTLEGQILSLAEKIDTVTGIFSVGLIPSGDKDPYGLRRASIGILRIINECKLDLNLRELIDYSLKQYKHEFIYDQTYQHVIDFISERLKGICLDQGYTIDEYLSVIACGLDYPVDFMKRMDAIKQFKSLPQAESLASANKRIRNILKKSDSEISINYQLLNAKEEKQLFKSATDISVVIDPLLHNREYTQALKQLSCLESDVNAFFDHVMVMVDDSNLRASRLGLLQMISKLFLKIADVSKLQH